MIVYKETHFQKYVELNSVKIVNKSFMYMRKGLYWCKMETMKIMNNEKVASLWVDKNVTLNTESSSNGLMWQV